MKLTYKEPEFRVAIAPLILAPEEGLWGSLSSQYYVPLLHTTFYSLFICLYIGGIFIGRGHPRHTHPTPYPYLYILFIYLFLGVGSQDHAII